MVGLDSMMRFTGRMDMAALPFVSLYECSDERIAAIEKHLGISKKIAA
jgi:hypothetical protein